MHAESTPLPHQAVEHQRGILSELVVFNEDLLKLVDNQQDARHRLGVARSPIPSQVLYSEIAKEIATPLQLAVELLQHREAKLAFAFDRDHTGMWKLVVVVNLKLHALLKVDEIELHFVGAVGQREVGNQRMHHR